MHGQPQQVIDENIGQAARYASLSRYADELEAQVANGEDSEMAAEALAARAAADAILERVGLR